MRRFLDDQHIAMVEELKLDVELGKPEMPIGSTAPRPAATT